MDTQSLVEQVTGTYTVWSISQLYPMSVGIIFPQESGKWLISFYSTAFGTNLIATGDVSRYFQLSESLTIFI